MYIYITMLSMRNLCYPQDLYVKKKEEIYNIDIYIQEQDATLFDITRCILYIYVCRKKNNRNGELLVYS